MKLPNGENAFIDMRKLEEYALNPNHPLGLHKAHVFRAALGLTAEHAPLLRDALLAAARDQEVHSEGPHEFGRRFVIDFEMTGVSGRAIVRSAWIIRMDEDFPRLTTCHIL